MLEILNPATEEVVESLEPAAEGDADAAIARARDAFPAWRNVQPDDRSRLLRRLADALEAEQENLAQLESKNTGKPIGDSRGEMAMVAETFHYYAGDRKSTRLNSSHANISYAVFCLKKKKKKKHEERPIQSTRST